MSRTTTTESRVNRDDYPALTLAGKLLGVTGTGYGTYVEEVEATVMDRHGEWAIHRSVVVTRVVPAVDAHPEFDCVYCVPRDENFEEAQTEFTADERSLADYIIETASDLGPWNCLTGTGNEAF